MANHSLTELYGLMGTAGLPDPQGFPLRALMAGIAEAESLGDPHAWIPHDPPSRPNAPPSSGIFQVNQGIWPAIYEATERVRNDRSTTDEEKILAMTALVKPILMDDLTAALAAARTLATRGVKVTLLNTALFVDAAWQTGAGHLAKWAVSTKSGDPHEIVNPTRTVAIEVALRNLASEALGVSSGVEVAVAVLGGVLIAVFVLAKWNP
jgi:hypothetical protein